MSRKEWSSTTLREAGVSLIDCVHKTPPAAIAGYPYVAIPQLIGGRIDFSTARRITPEHHHEWTRKAKPQPHDVVLSRRCNPGETAVDRSGQEFSLGQNLVLLRADGRTVHPAFLRWLVRGPDWWNAIQKNLNVGAVFDSLKCADVPNFELPIPPIGVQGVIADILDALDDKIEHNRKTSRALEGLARVMFKAWFVDFEPVHAKAAGATSFPGMPAEAFAALPARFVDSELGPVPEGWEIVDVYSLAKVVYGAPFKSKLFNEIGEGKRLIRIRDLQTHLPTVYTPEEHPKGTLIQPGDIVVGMDGEFRLHYWTGPEAWLNQRLCSFVPRPSIPSMFLGESLRAPLDYVERSEAATTVIHLGKYDIDRFRLLRPSDRVLDAFGTISTPILKSIVQAAAEARKLAELRDYLLPKLLSGEVRAV